MITRSKTLMRSGAALAAAGFFASQLPDPASALTISLAPDNPVAQGCPQSLDWGRNSYSPMKLCYGVPDGSGAGMSGKGAPQGDFWDGSYAPTARGLYAAMFAAGNGGTAWDNHEYAANDVLLNAPLIRLIGQIEAGDAAKLESFIRDNGLSTCVRDGFCPFNFTISLNSPGGSLSEALKIAELIRAQQAVTLLEENAVCASSCVFAFVAGYTDYAGMFFPRRFAHESARIGVHQPALVIPEGSYSADQMRQAVELANTVQSEALRQFVSAQVDILVLKEMYDTPASSLSYLSPARMSRIARIYGRGKYTGDTVPRGAALAFCAGEYEIQTGQPPPPSLLDNLDVRPGQFLTYSDTEDYACYGARTNDGAWMADACIGQDCLFMVCAFNEDTGTWEDYLEELGPLAPLTQRCPRDGPGAGFATDLFYTSHGVALNALPGGTRARLLRGLLLDRYDGMDDYDREETGPFLSGFDVTDLVPAEYCGRIDFRAPERMQALQTLLNDAGFDAGTPDGFSGPRTNAAVAAANAALLGLTGSSPSAGLLTALGADAAQISAARLCTAG